MTIFLRRAACALLFLLAMPAALATPVAVPTPAPMPVAVPASVPIPPGFERQRLDPIGGEIARPAGWFFDQQETPSGWTWVLAEQDPRGGQSYLTGLRLQLVMGIEGASGLTRAAFVAGFAEQKKQQALAVEADCAVVDLGDFYRRCVEVRERLDIGGQAREFRVLYSLMWGKQLDWVVTSVFGAPAEEWERAKPINAAMAPFSIFDGDIDQLARHAGHVRTLAPPAAEPVGPILNPIDEGLDEPDPDGPLKNAVGRQYTYRDLVRTDPKYVPAKPLEGGLPPVAYAADGTRLFGTARIAYVITSEGRAAAVRVLATSDARLEPTLRAAAAAWRLTPATYDGQPVDVLAAQDFSFEPDPQ